MTWNINYQDFYSIYGGYLPMEKLQNENDTNHSGTILIDRNGTQYFVMGKVHIKVSEHFAQDGKPIDCLLEDVIQHAATVS